MTDHRCKMKGCRNPVALTYIRPAICWSCWSRISNASPEDEPALLADLGLRRTADGQVIEFRETRNGDRNP